MQNENNFLFNLANNVINIFNKLFNLSFMLAIFLYLSDALDNNKLYALAIVLYVFLLSYTIYCSYRLYITKSEKNKISMVIGFFLCLFLSVMLLSLTFSATFILNRLSNNL